MAIKNIKSTDPRKAKIVAALKAKSGARKVTLVRELSPGVFEGQCLGPVPQGKAKFVFLGPFQVTAAEAGLESLP